MRPNEMYNAEGIIIVWYASTRATSIPSRAHYSGREIPADVSGKVHEEQSWKLPSPRGRYHGFKLSRRGERGSSWNCWLHFVSPPRFEMSFVAMFQASYAAFHRSFEPLSRSAPSPLSYINYFRYRLDTALFLFSPFCVSLSFRTSSFTEFDYIDTIIGYFLF